MIVLVFNKYGSINESKSIKEGIDSILNKLGGPAAFSRELMATIDAYPGIEDDTMELADMMYGGYEDVVSIWELEDAIEYMIDDVLESTEAVNSSYSPELLNELVNYYSSFDTMSYEEIWDEIVLKYNNKNLANDVIESLDNDEEDSEDEFLGESLHESKSEFTEVLDVLESFGDLLEPDDISPDNITGTFNEEDLSKIKKKLKSLGFKYDSDRASFFSKDRFFEITLDGGEFEINEIFDEEDSEDEFLGESLHESKDIYADSQIRYELEQVLDYLENSAGAFKKILSRNRWNETATDSLVDDMKDCFNRVKKIAYSLDSDRYSMFDGR